MGGRGSFSGLLATIDDVLGIGEEKGPLPKPITNLDRYKTLEQSENIIRGLSKERLLVFDQDGKCIAGYQGNHNSVAFPVSEAEKWKGLTVTHNHPKSHYNFGGTFSFEDMRNATVYEFGSHRAVASGQGERNYILRAGSDARPMEMNRRIAADINWLRERMRAEATRIKEEYRKGNPEYKNYGHMLHVAGQKSVGVLNSYYREIAEQYGYTYRTQK